MCSQCATTALRALVFKGIVSRDEYFWRLIILNKSFWHIRWWFLQLFVSLLMKYRTQTQSFSFLLRNSNYLLILKILSVTLFKDPKEAILTLKMRTGSRLWFCKIIPEAACGSVTINSCAFSLQPMRGDTVKHRPIIENVFMRKTSVTILKIGSNFKAANKQKS
jgi:hypothetical protein